MEQLCSCASHSKIFGGIVPNSGHSINWMIPQKDCLFWSPEGIKLFSNTNNEEAVKYINVYNIKSYSIINNPVTNLKLYYTPKFLQAHLLHIYFYYHLHSGSVSRQACSVPSISCCSNQAWNTNLPPLTHLQNSHLSMLHTCTYMQGSIQAILHKMVNERWAEFVQHWLHGITCLEKESVKHQDSSN